LNCAYLCSPFVGPPELLAVLVQDNRRARDGLRLSKSGLRCLEPP
jgi:hypothetical protein